MNPKDPLLHPDLLQDCLSLTKDTIDTFQKIKQKRSAMISPIQTLGQGLHKHSTMPKQDNAPQITDEMLDDFRKSKYFSFMDGPYKMIKAWEEFKSSYSVSSSGKIDDLGNERWYLRENNPANSEPIGHIGYYTHSNLEGRSCGKYSTYRWFESKELAEAYRDNVLMADQIRNYKPCPIGIIPEWLWKEQRIKELKAAIKRYLEYDKKQLNLEWVYELSALEAWHHAWQQDIEEKSKIKGGEGI